MEKFRFIKNSQFNLLPQKPGVYTLKKGRDFFYIGKAASIRERVKNHFFQPNYKDNFFIEKVTKIGLIETGSEIEALLLEARLIKKYKPAYNVLWRDDKNYFFVEITNPACRQAGEKLPRVLITHQKKLKSTQDKPVEYVGPFVEGAALKKTLRILRKIFPYYTVKQHSPKPCLWCHLKLCPGPNPDIKEYKNNIKNLIAVLRGKKKTVVGNLRKMMEEKAKIQNFEEAAKLRNQIFALETIIAHSNVIESEKEESKWKNNQSILQKILKTKEKISRIEAYDISNIQGKEATGSMVVAFNGKLNKDEYRKFKIKISDKPNDVAMIKELISRRLQHNEWQYPEVMLIDGGKAQLNAALFILNQHKSVKSALIRVIALAKKKNELYIEGEPRPILLKTLNREIFNLILQLRDESHRFARAYHHKLRDIALMHKI